jgi:hypothetical protein
LQCKKRMIIPICTFLACDDGTDDGFCFYQYIVFVIRF